MRSRRIIIPFLAAVLLVAAGCGRQEKSGSKGEMHSGDSGMTTLDAQGIDAFLAASGTALIEFGGKRCVSCLEMRHNLEELQKKKPTLRIGFVYWEDSPELFERWKIGVIPVQIIFGDDGREMKRHRGVWETEEMLAVPAIAAAGSDR